MKYVVDMQLAVESLRSDIQKAGSGRCTVKLQSEEASHCLCERGPYYMALLVVLTPPPLSLVS